VTLTFAVGDIHGCVRQLDELLDVIETTWSSGRVVFLGDYVDRGPDSASVVDRLISGPSRSGWEWITLKGNHEAMMVAALRHGVRHSIWLENGGLETLESYRGPVSSAVLDWMEQRPAILCDTHRIFVHAGVDESVPLDAQDKQTLLWSRPSVDPDQGYWGRHLCHGHTPRDENPTTTGNRTNIDSGCVFGGHLTAAVFDDDLPGPPVRFVKIANAGR
jgi:serine/threonine protein phosphatase 1